MMSDTAHVCFFERHEDGECYCCVECGDEYVCPRPSRFLVRRDPNDGSYSPEEACEGHVADTMAALYDGDDLASMIVVMHWDGYPRPPCENRRPLDAEMRGEKEVGRDG
jgi:hypothetical protein